MSTEIMIIFIIINHNTHSNNKYKIKEMIYIDYYSQVHRLSFTDIIW